MNEDANQEEVGLETCMREVYWVVDDVNNLKMVYYYGVELHKVYK